MRMTPRHPRWAEFVAIMSGPLGCNFQEEHGKTTWQCDGGTDKKLATRTLRERFPDVDVAGSLAYFEQHGGYCDCEILFTVADDADLRLKQ
jgi:hypothetical protein